MKRKIKHHTFPLSRESEKFEKLAEIFKALSYSKRIKIFLYILNRKEPLSSSEIAKDLHIPVTTVNRHLQHLRKKKYLFSIRKGNEVKYNIERRYRKLISSIISLLKHLPAFPGRWEDRRKKK